MWGVKDRCPKKKYGLRAKVDGMRVDEPPFVGLLYQLRCGRVGKEKTRDYKNVIKYSETNEFGQCRR